MGASDADFARLREVLAGEVLEPDLIVAVWDRRLHAGAVTAGLRLAPASLATGAGHGG